MKSASLPKWTASVAEPAIAVAVILGCAWLGRATHWAGTPSAHTMAWPFYLDNYDSGLRVTGRVLVPLLGLALAWLPLRRWLREQGDPIVTLLALVAAAYVVHLGCGLMRYGLENGLARTFNRDGLEYWGDIAKVKAGFLASFPEVGDLTEHGGTHPPGLILLLAAVHALGFTTKVDAEFACSGFGALAALPLWGAARRLTDETTARWAVAFALFACSVVAYAILAMDIVNLFLAALALYGLARALDGERVGGAIWGLAYAAASFCSFTNLLLGLTFGALILRRRRDLGRQRLIALACGPLAFFVFYAVLVIGFGYRPLHVFGACLARFKVTEGTRRPYARWLLGNPVAFLGALGLPLAGLTGRALFDAGRRLARRQELGSAALVAAAALPPLTCIALGTPRGEVEHVFLPFVPATVIAAAFAARRWYGRQASWMERFAVPALVAQSILIETFYNTAW